MRLHAIVATDGHIQPLDVISGHPLLQQAALDAVRQWRYEPTLLNNEAVEVDTTIDVLFAMEDHSVQPPLGIDPQLRGDILLMFKVIHFKESAMAGGRRAFESMRPMLVASLPDTANREKITDAYIEKLLAALQSDAYLERVVGLYAKYFSDSDIQQLIQFYQTPAGQRFFAAMPQLSADLSQVGQSVAMENLGTIFKQLCRQFPELEEDPRFCKEPDLQRNSELSVPRAAKAVGL